MTRLYLPRTEHRPLLRREVRGSGGLTFAAILFLLVFALPAVAGACLAVVEFEAVSEVVAGSPAVSVPLDGADGRG